VIIIRAIIFTVALAFGFILSGSLDGIGKIRAGTTDLASSIINSFQGREITANTNNETGAGIGGDLNIGSDIGGGFGSDITIATDTNLPQTSDYATPKNAKYLVIAIGVIFGIFTATLVGAGLIGLVGGVLFSPEIASVPFLAEAAVSVSSAVSALWADLITKIIEISQ